MVMMLERYSSHGNGQQDQRRKWKEYQEEPKEIKMRSNERKEEKKGKKREENRENQRVSHAESKCVLGVLGFL